MNNAYSGVGNYHGFNDTISVSETGTKTIYIYAINIGGGNTNPLLGTKTVTISAKPTPATISGQNLPGTLNKGNAFSIRNVYKELLFSYNRFNKENNKGSPIMKPTIKDIAQRAHVSTATVSRVLSKKAKSYRPETAAKKPVPSAFTRYRCS